MVRSVEKMISRYGSSMVLIQNEDEFSIRAFVQETKSKSQGSAEREFHPLGEVAKGLYVYIGPVTPAARVGDELIFRGKSLELRRVELVMVDDQALYCWGLCVEKGSG